MKFGFNSIAEIARIHLEREGIRFYRSDNGMWDVDAPENFRVAKWPGTDTYYYMFKDECYTARNDTTPDWSTYPPTMVNLCILSYVDSDVQPSIRDFLMQRPPNNDSAAGGVLV